MSTNRLESFSDGVMAVAITLLVLNISVPEPRPGHALAHDLVRQWPTYAAYVTSFVTIGIIWINHHAMVSRLGKADRAILFLNLLLLLCVGVIPFATALFATYLKQGSGQSLAAAVYAGTFLVTTVVFATLGRHILIRKGHLLSVDLTLAQRREIIGRGFVGVVPYALAMAVAPVSPYATLIICAAIAVYYALPVASGRVQQ